MKQVINSVAQSSPRAEPFGLGQMSLRLGRFAVVRPRYEVPQEETLNWLAEAHTEAESRLCRTADFDRATFRDRIARLMRRYGCSVDKIARRASDLPDFTHTRWGEMRIFNLGRNAEGGGQSARSEFYAETTAEVFERLYAGESEGPSDLIHVTCTGYISPSAAQRLVSRKGWEHTTRVTHAYHMGCHAAFPAIRLAAGCLSTKPAFAGASLRGPRRCDLVHTELCSIHFRPAVHTPEQLVVQGLFADGYVRYSLTRTDDDAFDGEGGLDLLALHEEIVPDSLDDMTWVPSDWGMQMTLSRNVPDRIAESVAGFLQRLYERADLTFDDERAESVFAIHPGGPKIVDHVQEVLGLTDAQVSHSRTVLLACGNMSSATLPHVWNEIVRDESVTTGTLIASLAFGPGLTISGGLFAKG